MDSADLFEDLHSLEDSFYQEGYDAGAADGSRAGRIEGRVFGLEKGFEKFVALGRLSGQSKVWMQRLHTIGEEHSGENNVHAANAELPSLMENPRLRKHITTLRDLVDPDTYDTRNNEDAVADFDNRYKRAKAKVKVIEKIVGEDVRSLESVDDLARVSNTRPDLRISSEQAQEKNMEDFGRDLARATDSI
ncbi:DUF1715-domain-containing protein [Pseudovirgaria hyperparasitica]|uniref:DUF1715-domain-containing protein n=1 Tax=Pseudovirgaria hyperparasitica TaxID=470096 RepID=A0A6A6WBU0_9PEZI|nr:DUF1715-domain-containing protein [Pseudovirgaria hyperparasitica]KAF2759430.1 DUF1715-domain-containing protein [Pseudovirgaria hyperparasitica]